MTLQRDARRLTTTVSALVVDDHDLMRAIIRELLESEGISVADSPGAVGALSALEAHQPDVLITDLSMPGMDGLELAGTVRRHVRCGALPIILITAEPEDARVAQARRLGGLVVVDKTSTNFPSDLVGRVRDCNG